MKVSFEKIVLDNIKSIKVYPRFYEDGNVELCIKLEFHSYDSYNSKIYDLYKCYLENKFEGDNFQVIKRYVDLFVKCNKALKVNSSKDFENGYEVCNLEIDYPNSKKLSVSIPVKHNGLLTKNTNICIKSSRYEYILEKVSYDIFEYLFDYYTSFDIKKLIIFDSDNLFIDLHYKKNIKNSDSIYAFTNNDFDNSILKDVLDDFIDNNISDINSIKLSKDKLLCSFNGDKVLECSTNLSIIKDRMDELENAFLDKKILSLKNK